MQEWGMREHTGGFSSAWTAAAHGTTFLFVRVLWDWRYIYIYCIQKEQVWDSQCFYFLWKISTKFRPPKKKEYFVAKSLSTIKNSPIFWERKLLREIFCHFSTQLFFGLSVFSNNFHSFLRTRGQLMINLFWDHHWYYIRKLAPQNKIKNSSEPAKFFCAKFHQTTTNLQICLGSLTLIILFQKCCQNIILFRNIVSEGK